jgi:hypothetical protein
LPINAYLRRLLAVGKDGGQNLLLQKIETGLDIDATIVRNRVVAASEEAIEIERSKWIVIGRVRIIGANAVSMQRSRQQHDRGKGMADRQEAKSVTSLHCD